jgi:hypothetical protein
LPSFGGALAASFDPIASAKGGTGNRGKISAKRHIQVIPRECGGCGSPCRKNKDHSGGIEVSRSKRVAQSLQRPDKSSPICGNARHRNKNVHMWRMPSMAKLLLFGGQ